MKKNILKKTLILLTLFNFRILIFSENYSYSVSSETEITLFNEVLSAYKNNFYPGVVSAADDFTKKFSDSVYIPDVLSYKAESLVYLKDFAAAENCLAQVLEMSHTGEDNFVKAVFLFGKSKFYQKEFVEALSYLKKVSSLIINSDLEEIENQSVLLTAKSLYFLEEYEKATLYFESVISNGKKYSQEEYCRALNSLVNCYLECGQLKKITALFESLPENYFEKDFYFQLCLFTAQAYEELSEYKKSFALYSKVIEGDRGTKAVIALKKAYLISEKFDVGINAGDFFANSILNFENEDDFVEEFYLRLGIDSYNAGDFQTALLHFESIKSSLEKSENAVNADFYKAKILMEQKKYEDAFEKLQNLKKYCNEKNSDGINSSLLICAFNLKNIQEAYNQIPSFYEAVKNPDYTCKYIYSAYFYEKGNFEKVLPDVKVLYASSLCRQQKYSLASAVYAELEKNNQMTSQDYLEYSKALFYQKNYNAAYEKALKSKESDSDFICALCAVNLKNWNSAKNHFYSYIKSQSGKKDFNPLCFYYKGISEFSLGENKDAYSSFVRYISEAKDSLYLLNSFRYAAQTSVLNHDSKNAYFYGRQLLEKSDSKNEIQTAVIFLYEIYLDFNDLKNAENLLVEYKNGNSDFNARIKILLAELYQRQGKIASSDSEYQSVLKENAKSSYAQEAAYRNGELFYSAQNYDSALKRFSEYIYSYPNGTYIESAIFYAGDSAFKIGEYERCIMYCKTLLQNNEKSIFAFSAQSNLLNSYYEKSDYNSALQTAKNIILNFPEEAKNSGIDKKAGELELIVSGVSPAVVEKKSAFEQNKEENTMQGRILGSELVALYEQNPLTKKDAFELALKILPKQNLSGEEKYAAQNAEVVADYYRTEFENSSAAEYYLKSAGFYRSAGNENKAASVLYSAVEAFVAADSFGDAVQTANLLKELYPKSRYAQRVDNLLK